MRYIIYIRVSTDMQDISTQRDNCIEYINSIKDKPAQIIEFQDPEVTTRIPMANRKGLQSMLEFIKKGDVVITPKLDRLSRDIIEMVTIHRLIVSKGGRVYSLFEQETEDWMLGIFGSLAQKERSDISQRIKASLRAKRLRGERVGHIPYGYMLTKKIKRTDENKGEAIMIKENLEEIEVLVEMERLRGLGVSFRKMATLMNEGGYRNRDGQPWTHSAIARVWDNRRLSEALFPCIQEEVVS